eukprot:11310934-Alexandrium_andersonii.AAC.1
MKPAPPLFRPWPWMRRASRGPEFAKVSSPRGGPMSSEFGLGMGLLCTFLRTRSAASSRWVVFAPAGGLTF